MGWDSSRRISTAVRKALARLRQERCGSGTPDLDTDAAVERHPGQGVIEEQVDVGLAGGELAALGIADEPGGRLQATD
jgi:hypothetical protein